MSTNGLEYVGDLRADRAVRPARGRLSPALWLSLAAAGVLWLVVADCLVAFVGYVDLKVASGELVYAVGHLCGLTALLLVSRRLLLTPHLEKGGILSRLTRLRGVLLLIGAMTLLRLAWVLLVPTQPTSDNAVYHGLAVRLAETGVYDTAKHRAYWPPGYPAFLAALYAGFGASLVVAKFGNVVLAGLVDLLSWQLVRRQVGAAAAVRALLITAAWPGRNLHVDVLSYDELAVALLLASLAILPRGSTVARRSAADRPAKMVAVRWITAGLVLGLACLVRPTLGLTPLAIGGWLLVNRCPWRPAALRSAVYTAAMLAAIAPWTIRNYAVLGRVVPITTNAGGNFYNSWAPGGNGSFYKPAWEHLQVAAGGDELKLSPMGFALGLDAIRAEPRRAVERIWEKQVQYLGSDNWLLPVKSYTAALGGDARRGALLKTLLHIATNGWYVLLMLAPFVLPPGVARCFREQPLAWLCLAVFVLGLIMHTVFEAQARYHLVYLPFWGLMLASLLAGAHSRPAAMASR
jgi:4-amino-4-deoxy-L-arabinose transferase-like glycosyltransferase